MSPTLSRENYFLTVINDLKNHHVEKGSMEHDMQELLLDLAETVKNKNPINQSLLLAINMLFERYQAVRLKVSIIPTLVKSPIYGSNDERNDEVQQQILFHTEFIDAADQLKRMYMESIISLLETMEKKGLDLQKCIQCDSWFIPYQRAQITKFCSSKCRNRYNYVLRNITKEEKVYDYSEIR
ncbi:hypothetical protein [Paenibacillus sp. L3-i20]|uniref:hypothetical protein n=1 Tax=Paenibacillus sp. L3-i20 TaxID=2905833 RepID=UPI001EE00102|nr:hypothetical protein [Paenibacillus sp. L3-i20]GKU80102.1 hypothetical protein L3i20_v244990 [Paenibacillus sp. L3-i20]